VHDMKALVQLQNCSVNDDWDDCRCFLARCSSFIAQSVGHFCCACTQGTVVAIHFHQPNGYLQLADSTILACALGWPSQTYPYNSSVALYMGGGSLNVVNCDLENQAGEGWRDPGARVVR
jgi:hypothetical protein